MSTRLFLACTLTAASACTADTTTSPPAGGGPGKADASWDGDPDEASADDPSQQGGTDTPGGAERTFVNDFLDVPSDPSIGFDLDQHLTAGVNDPIGCGHADGPGGIDNQLGQLLDGVVDAANIPVPPNQQMADNIHWGRLLLVTRLMDIDDPADDGDVPLLFYVGHDPDGDSSNNLSGGGHLQVHPISLADPSDLESALLRFEGEITDRTWESAPAVFRISVPLGQDVPLELVIEEARVRFTLGNDEVREGVVGGVLPIQTILDTIERPELQTLGIPTQIVRQILGSQADLDVIPEGPTGATCGTADDCEPGQACQGGGCYEPDNRCDALSVAMRFHAVPVTIDGIAPEGTPAGW